MPGSWEQMNSVLGYVLHTETTSVAWAFGLRNLQIPGPIIPLAGMPFDHARNAAAKMMLDQGFEWLFSLDSDVIAPNDAVLRLLAHKQPFISGLYHRRSPPHSVGVMIRNGQWVTNYQRGKIIEVDLVGAGCLLIHRSVVESFFRQPIAPGHPMFSWQVDMQGILPPGECLSEDFTTCLEWRRRGGKVLVDTSICCRHVGNFQTGDGTAVPLETVSQT